MGLEYISQPQVFLNGLTALGPGIQGLTENYPLLTTYYSWTSTAAVPASAFYIPIEVGSIYNGSNNSGSFIVAVTGSVISPTQYTVDALNRTITLNTVIPAGVQIGFTQLATAAPSSTSFDFIKSVSAEFLTLSAQNIIGNAISITASNVNITNTSIANAGITNASIASLTATNLLALSSILNIVDITQYELSGFNVQGNANIIGNTTVSGIVSATTTDAGLLSARSFTLVHDPANDGVDPIFDIGETLASSFSGFRVRYEEPTNRLICSSRTGTTVLTSLMINVATGQVGVSGLPAPGQALTVTGSLSASGNISTSGAIKGINIWPNRQYRILSADEVQFAANTGTTLWSTTPLIIQPNYLYNTAFYAVVSSTSTTPSYAFSLSGNAPFSILEGLASTGSITTEAGNPAYGRDLRELNTGTPSSVHAVIPLKTYTSVGPHGFSINPVISSASTTQIILSCFSGAVSRVKASSSFNGALIQSI